MTRFGIVSEISFIFINILIPSGLGIVEIQRIMSILGKRRQCYGMMLGCLRKQLFLKCVIIGIKRKLVFIFTAIGMDRQ